MRSALWRMGLRFRKNVSSLPGKPDIVFSRARVVVFCDGDFWHGRNWPQLQAQLQRGSNPQYWVPKIAYNMERDSLITQALLDAGWTVLRLWEKDIEADLQASVKTVVALLDLSRARLGQPSNEMSKKRPKQVSTK